MFLIKRLKTTIMKSSRERKFNHFSFLYKGGKVLDVGVSGKRRIKHENFFIDRFSGDSSNYIGLTIETTDNLEREYPKKKFVKYDGKIFPFDDKEFEWVFCNAVVEHVGNEDDQIFFLNEMLRVSKNVFFTTPNRFFPVESHTNVILLHWLPIKYFYRWCKKNRPYWVNNLRLLSYRGLKKILTQSNAKNFEIQKNRLLFFIMTFSIICRN